MRVVVTLNIFFQSSNNFRLIRDGKEYLRLFLKLLYLHKSKYVTGP